MRGLGNLLSLETINGIESAVRGPHRVLVRVKVAEHDTDRWLTSYTEDPSAANPDDNEIWRDPQFLVVEGSVSESVDSSIIRSLELTVVSDYWQSIQDVLEDVSPYKTLMSVERGVETGQGSFYAPLGVFRVTKVSVGGSAGEGRAVSVQGYSMESDVADHRFITLPQTGTYVPGSAVMGTAVDDVIVNLVREAFGLSDPTLLPVRFTEITDELDHIFPAKYALATDVDRLKLVKDLEVGTTTWGKFDRLNSYELMPEPDPEDLPRFTVDAGPEGVLVSYGAEYTRDAVYNAVIVTGEDQETEWTYTYGAFTVEVDYPLNWGGPFGYKPKFFYSPLLKTVAAVEKAANRMLRKAIATKAGLDFEFVPNPLLEAGDVVEVVYGDGTVGHHLLDSIEIGLGADSGMSATTSAKTEEDE